MCPNVRLKVGKNTLKYFYRTTTNDCSNCPIKSTCLSKSKKCKQIFITAYRAEYERNNTRLKSDKRHKTKRMSTVEPLFGTLINFLGMRKVNTLGRAGAHKCMLMAACASNLKKLLKYAKKPIKTGTRHLEI